MKLTYHFRTHMRITSVLAGFSVGFGGGGFVSSTMRVDAESLKSAWDIAKRVIAEASDEERLTITFLPEYYCTSPRYQDDTQWKWNNIIDETVKAEMIELNKDRELQLMLLGAP